MTPTISSLVGLAQAGMKLMMTRVTKPNGDFTCLPNEPFDMRPEEEKEDDTRMAKRLLELLQGLKK